MKRRLPTNSGQPLGILMLDSTMVRPPGDIGNATTFSFPVVYRRVKGVATVEEMHRDDCACLPLVIEAARELEDEGVRAIVGGCGFMSLFQEALTAAVDIPVFTSTLMFVPQVQRALARGRKVGIVTADSRILAERHFRAVGWSSQMVPIAVAGMEGIAFVHTPAFAAEFVPLCQRLAADHSDIGALVFECTNPRPTPMPCRTR
jgi:hypothetical protein